MLTIEKSGNLNGLNAINAINALKAAALKPLRLIAPSLSLSQHPSLFQP